jgi:anti-sigma B factor antagonist
VTEGATGACDSPVPGVSIALQDTENPEGPTVGFTRHQSSNGFRCDIAPDGDHAVVRPIGELDMATIGYVEGPLQELAAAGFRDLVLDLRGLTFLDSTGIALLVRWQRLAAADGLVFGVVLGDERTRHPLELTGVLALLDVRPPE